MGNVPPGTSRASQQETPPTQESPPAHEGESTQRVALHTRVEQSDTTPQLLPTPQGAHAPPQSISVSVPSFTPLPQVAKRQIFPVQIALAQSAGTAQTLPTTQDFGQTPPQSTSVSNPFLKPSPHVGVAHWRVLGLQNPLVQFREPFTQDFPLPHLEQVMPELTPPQSMSDSVPFRKPSVHVAPQVWLPG